jgi:hypothetical protein
LFVLFSSRLRDDAIGEGRSGLRALCELRGSAVKGRRGRDET